MDGPPSNNGRRPITTPYIKIVEQPASKALRFRYECEGRSAGSIPGVNSTTENKTYPTIQIVGYKGRAVVVVSCVTKDRPFRPHPHNLVGRDNCKRGICTIEINNESMTASFQNLGIQCVKRKDIDEALKVREEIRVDPFRTGFSHKDNPTSIDLNAVRLCFQAFLGGTQKGKYSILEPIVSDPIYDKKAMSDLVICRLSDAAASVVGGREIILLCEKVTKDDIQVRFFEEKDGVCTWEGYADFQPSDVHKQVAISFRTPKYKVMQIDGPINVWIQLKRPTDGMCSEARPFLFTPVDSGMSPQKYDRLPDKSFNDYWADDQPEEKVPLSVFDKNKDNEDEDIKVEIKDEPMEVNEDTCYDINKENNEDSISSSSEVMGEDLRGTYSSLQMAFKNPCSIPERCQSYEDVSILPPRPPSSSKPKFDNNTAPPLPPKRVKKNPRPTKYLPTIQQKPSKIKLLHKLLSMRKRSKSMCSSNSSINEPINDTPLTEAENYALYTSVAPHAAMSEFDESSMYYSTVEGGTVTSVK